MIVYALVCLILAVVFGGSYYAYRMAFYSPTVDREKIPEVKGLVYQPYKALLQDMFHSLSNKPCEFVTIQSQDGLTLSGRYYHTADNAPLAIGFHGYKSSWLRDFCGGADIAFQLGHNLLLIDERSHGKSQGRSITFGIKERQDLLLWVDYAVNRFGPEVKIILYGVSMGGATVVMASELDLPSNVKGIVADCPYSSPMDVILDVGKKRGFPPRLIKPFVVLGAKVYGGFDVRETTGAEAVKQAKIPILIIHGEDDTFVPPEMSAVIADANPQMVERHTFPGAYHALSYMVDTPRYEALVKGFIKKVL
ncbi:MAG: alpha/beta hydrolase [Faecousia sp.]